MLGDLDVHELLSLILINKKDERFDKIKFIVNNKNDYLARLDDIVSLRCFNDFELFVVFFYVEVNASVIYQHIERVFDKQDFDTLIKCYYFVNLHNRRYLTDNFVIYSPKYEIESFIGNKLEELIDVSSLKLVKERCATRACQSIKRILLVSSIFSPNKLGAHYNLSVSILKTIANYKNSSFEIGMALSGESSFEVFDEKIRCLKGSHVVQHKKNWLELGFNIDNLFIGSVAVEDNSVSSAFFEWVAEFSPDLVLCVGDVFESKFYRRALYSMYPIAFYPMSTKNDPRGYVDGIITKNDAFFENMVRKSYDCVLDVLPPIFDVYLPEPVDGAYNFRKKENDVVFMTALQADRVGKIFTEVLSDNEVEELLSIFRRNENFVWVIVGQGDISPILNRVPELAFFYQAGRVYCIGYVDNIRSVISACDCAFVIPQMTGGNQTVCTAMADGLVAVCWVKSDSAGVVPPQHTFSNEAEMRNIIDRLCNDNGYLSESKLAAMNSIKCFSPSGVSDSWGQYFNRIIDFGIKRLSKDEKMNSKYERLL